MNQKLDDLIEQLGNPEPTSRKAAAYGLRDLNALEAWQAAPALLDLLTQDPSMEVKRAAADALEFMPFLPAEQAGPLLKAGLETGLRQGLEGDAQGWSLCFCCLKALEVCRDLTATEAVRALLTAPNQDLRESAVRMLGLYRLPERVPDLLKGLEDSEPAVRLAALEALRLIDADERADASIKALLQLLETDPDESVRANAAISLGQMPAARAWAEVLMIRLKHESSDFVRRMLITALGELRAEAAYDALLALLKPETNDENPASEMFFTTLVALGRLGDRRATPLLIEILLGSDDSFSGQGLCSHAAEALELLGDETAVGPLLEILARQQAAESKSTSVFTAAAEALVRLEAEACLPYLLTALSMDDDDFDPERRWMAAIFLGDLGLPEACQALSECLEDADPQVAIEAARSLGKIGCSACLDALIEVLPDRETGVTAAEALGRLGDQQAEAPLLEVLADPDHPGRGEAALALARLGCESALEPSRELINDRSAEVQVLAARALVLLAGASIREIAPDILLHPNPAVRLAIIEGLKPEASDPDVWAFLTAQPQTQVEVSRRLANG
ncbi:MAG: HEAT repeat domain-containing protein [Candidatus Sericytochromatia bacterium]